MMSKTASNAAKASSEQSRKLTRVHKPVLKWLGTFSSNTSPNHSSRTSPLASPVATPSSTRSSSPPSPAIAALNDALESPMQLPTIPPIARLGPGFSTSRALHHSPPFLDNLTRSTMPTASVSTINRFDAYPFDRQPQSPASPTSPRISSHSRGGSSTNPSSLETLRSVSRRDSTRLSHQLGQRPISTVAPVSPEESTDVLQWPKNWWWNSNKEDTDELLGDDDRRETVAEEANAIQTKYRSPKHPIVFCHGLLGFDSVTVGPSIAPIEVSHWRGIKEVLEANGVEVLITRVPATSTPVDRALVLEQKISEVYPGRSVHLIGHSMGGIDCRYLTSKLTQRKFNVLSVTTIATPHRGSSFADHFLATLGMQRLPQFLGLLDLLPNGGGDGRAFEFLTLENMRRFNEDVKDVEGVQYFSWGASHDPGFVDTFKWPHSIILEKEGPNDGLVSVESAKWGTYLGTLEGVNHLDLVGWINTARYKWAEMLGKNIKFRPATFYLGVADMLAERVEGQRPAGQDGDMAGVGADVQDGEAAGPKPDSQNHGRVIRNGNERVTMTTGEDIDKITGSDDELDLRSPK
ncbi:alpha/beta-hydrolase [Cylindrobasidium torrendii FP15055 ss-10]|uniref:GPI inositol-deacylase n=1 Tax=Cylindrobasidium torrendii FP15055 ss-10 TaxID=1314674 RepID=A0A0D7B0M7_9AGAR|nr:alpha/beta-hydrolase [Cylindrobasidium torrendii FP15055 ss-10]